MAVDLRSQHDKTYSQGADNACGPFAVANALDCIYERATDQPTRFDPYHLWYWSRFHMGLAGVNIGSTFDSLSRALSLNGMKLGDEVLTGFELKRTFVSDRRYAELKHLLSMGMPVIWEMKVTPDLYALADQKDWRAHQISPDTAVTHGQHYVSIVGFDDDAQRWLVENSWGPDWADGGFFGVPYASLPTLTESMQHLNMAPINPKPVGGYRMPAYLTTFEKSAFVDRSTQALLKHLMASMNNGVQSLIDECVVWGVSDKHLETLAGWDRGAVRAYQAEHPELKWTGFVWEQL